MKRSKATVVLLRYVLVATAFIWLVFFWGGESLAAEGLRLVIDGRLVSSDPPPVLLNGRTMVPARLVSEALGARVDWVAADNSVQIATPTRSVALRIDSHLVTLVTGAASYLVTDVAPSIIGGRTYVPLRLVSNALGVYVSWDESTRTVFVDSSRDAVLDQAAELRIVSVAPGAVISSSIGLRAEIAPGSIPAGAEIRWLLVRPETGRGFVVGRGRNITGTYAYTPDTMNNGDRVLVAAMYSAQGRLLKGVAVPVAVEMIPRVAFSGITAGQVVQGTVTLRPVLNFPAAYITYDILAHASGRRVSSPKVDPLAPYAFTPMLEDSGPVSITMTAYNMAGQAFPSETVGYIATVSRQVELRGVTSGATIARPLTVSVNANFGVVGIEYMMRDVGSGVIVTLGRTETEGLRFVPSPSGQGQKEFFARVTDSRGEVFETQRVRANVSGASFVLMSGVGPREVVTGAVTLSAESNIALEQVRYVLTNRTDRKSVV